METLEPLLVSYIIGEGKGYPINLACGRERARARDSMVGHVAERGLGLGKGMWKS